jgi:beta-glucosidase
VRRLAEELPNRPLLLTGFGMTTDDDNRRAELVRTTDEVLRDARSDGLQIEGWFYDCAIDTYDPRFGYRIGRGLFNKDREAKPSAIAVSECG